MIHLDPRNRETMVSPPGMASSCRNCADAGSAQRVDAERIETDRREPARVSPGSGHAGHLPTYGVDTLRSHDDTGVKHHARVHGNAVIQVDYLIIDQPGTAVRYPSSQSGRVVGSVNSQERIASAWLKQV